jgi:hypothetical protein
MKKTERVPVLISAGPCAVWIVANDGTIWHTASDAKNGTYWKQAPSLPQQI